MAGDALVRRPVEVGAADLERVAVAAGGVVGPVLGGARRVVELPPVDVRVAVGGGHVGAERLQALLVRGVADGQAVVADRVGPGDVLVVQPRRGAFPEIVGKTGGGLIVTADDPGALADGLLELWRDPARAAALGARGAEGVRQHYEVGRMAEAAESVYDVVRRSC